MESIRSSENPAARNLASSSCHDLADKLRQATSAKPSTVVGKLATAFESLGSAFMAETSKGNIPQNPEDMKNKAMIMPFAWG
jgi:hypothetical protein